MTQQRKNMGMTLEEFKARIAQPEGPIAKPKRVPFSKHDPSCKLQETGRHTATCERCKALKRKKAKKAAARRHTAKATPSRKSKRPRSSDSVFAVSGGLPSLGKGSR
jgi:hypothetical protein